MAAAQSWHPAFAMADAAVRAEPLAIPAHAAVETYSVLTRVPEPDRASPADALAYLSGTFGRRLLALPAREQGRLLGAAADRGIAGGAIYDALVGATAAHAGATLLTLDRRAVRTYQAIGVDFRLLA